MSDPVANVQIEDVLSSIRRLVSEEIGQQEPLKLRAKKADEDEEHKLVLSPAQKIRQDAAEKGADLWAATEDLAPTEAAPVWWHRDSSELMSNEPDEPMQLGAPVAAEINEPQEISPEPEIETALVVEEAAAEDPRVSEPQENIEAAIDIEDDEFEPPEGETDIDFGVKLDAMPWQDDDADTEYSGHSDETSDSIETSSEHEMDDAPFSFRPGERLFERLSSKKMTASHLPEVETVESSAMDEDAVSVTDAELDALLYQEQTEVEESDVNEVPELIAEAIDETEPVEDNYFDADLETGDLTNIFDEDMLRDMVKDIIRQELQGVLGERITRNVRKLVRREIQRTLSDVNKI